MKDYVDSMALPTQISLRQLCGDWATTKINALDAERGGEAMVASLRNAVREVELGKREWEEKARGMESEIRRVNEFKQRAVELRKREKEWREKAQEAVAEKTRLVEDLQLIKVTSLPLLCPFLPSSLALSLTSALPLPSALSLWCLRKLKKQPRQSCRSQQLVFKVKSSG
jgi:hypothetical protein